MPTCAPACDHLEPTIALLRDLFRRLALPLTGGAILGACQLDPSIAVRAPALSVPGGVCVDGRSMVAAGVNPATSIDYLSHRSTLTGPRRVDVWIMSAAGVPCRDASAPELCLAEIDRLSVREAPDGPASYLLSTEGDTVRAWKTLEEKLALLGAIDTPAEAALLVEHASYPVDCNTEVSAADGSFEVVSRKYNACDGLEQVRYRLQVDADGAVTELATEVFEGDTCAVGRRPPGLCRPPRTVAGNPVGRYFARASRLEAASVDAFEILERDLVRHGLPSALRRAIREAASDEVRHARDTAALAESFGARPMAASVARYARRPLSQVALENALEGCVSETYGAYVATLQAALAPTEPMRRVLRGIAEDETRHAALSWQLAAWIEPQLPADQQRAIHARRNAAIAALG